MTIGTHAQLDSNVRGFRHATAMQNEAPHNCFLTPGPEAAKPPLDFRLPHPAGLRLVAVQSQHVRHQDTILGDALLQQPIT
jgi:hypothetical protein